MFSAIWNACKSFFKPVKETLKQTLGIDISKDTFDIALYQDGHYQLGHLVNNQAGNKKLLTWLRNRQAVVCHVCIEATGRYGQEVAEFLHEAKYQVSIVNPARVKAYANSQLKRNKTDREDAKLITHFCSTQKPALWTPSPAEVQELQELVHRLDRLKSMRTQESNRRQSGLKSSTVLASIDDHLTYLMEQIKKLEAQIKELIDTHPDLKQQRDLLVSIKGISDTTAAKFLAEVPDIHQFKSAAQLAAYTGLTPRHKSSVTSVRSSGHLSKMENAHLRTAMFMPALTAMRWNPILKSFASRLQNKGKLSKVIIAAVMRKLIHIGFGVLKSGKPFDPNYLQNQQVGLDF